MLILAELIGRPPTVMEFFAPGIAATLMIMVFYIFSCARVIPLYLFIGFLSFYLGWFLLSLLIISGFTHRPLGGYLSPIYCVVACIVAVIIARYFLKRGVNRKNEYKSLLIGVVFVFIILSRSMPAIL